MLMIKSLEMNIAGQWDMDDEMNADKAGILLWESRVSIVAMEEPGGKE